MLVMLVVLVVLLMPIVLVVLVLPVILRAVIRILSARLAFCFYADTNLHQELARKSVQEGTLTRLN
jgi:hypothetical protein